MIASNDGALAFLPAAFLAAMMGCRSRNTIVPKLIQVLCRICLKSKARVVDVDVVQLYVEIKLKIAAAAKIITPSTPCTLSYTTTAPKLHFAVARDNAPNGEDAVLCLWMHSLNIEVCFHLRAVITDGPEGLFSRDGDRLHNLTVYSSVEQNDSSWAMVYSTTNLSTSAHQRSLDKLISSELS